MNKKTLSKHPAKFAWQSWFRVLLAVVTIGLTGTLVAWSFGFKLSEFNFVDLLRGNTSSTTSQVERAPITTKATRGDVQKTVSAPGKLVNTHEVVLSMEVVGRITSISVRPGSVAKKGEALIEIDTKEVEADIATRKASYLEAQLAYSQTIEGPSAAQIKSGQSAVASAEAAYAELSKQPSENEIAGLKAALQKADAAVRRAQADYDRAYSANPSSISAAPESLALEQATNDYAAAKASYDKAFDPPTEARKKAALSQIAIAKSQLQALYPGSSNASQAKSKMDRASVLLAEAEAKIHKSILVAPFDGTVVEINAKVGETIQPGTGLIVFTDPAALELQASVIEEDLPLMKPGQPVEVFMDALAGVPLTGKVVRINPKRLAGDRPLYAVYVALDQVPQNVAEGMTSDSAILIDQRKDAVRLPRALVQAGKDGTALVEIWSDGKREKRKISVGLRGDVYTEIVSGLNDGEQVISK